MKDFVDKTLGLQNRNTFKWLIDRTLNINNNLFSILIIINPISFKEINKAYGFDFGDKVLLSIAERLINIIDKHNFITKLDSDKFGVFLKGFRKKEDILLSLQNLLNVLKEPYLVQTEIISLCFNLGLSIAPVNGLNSQDLLDKANIALFDASLKGENTIGFFKEELVLKAKDCLTLRKELENSIEKNNIVAYYQPYVDKDKNIIGAEALMRWIKDDKVILPMEFIDYLESSNLIIEAEKLIFNQIFLDLKDLIDQGVNINFSVNLSKKSIEQKNIIEFILSGLTKYHLKGVALKIEIIERAFLGNFNYVNSLIKSFKKHNIYFALDDFGIGYSSLSYIDNLFIKYLKIDMSFVTKMLLDDRTKYVIESIISLSQKLDIKTIAEGVETLGQFEMLKSMGCDYFQGYLFYRPMPKEQFFDVAKKNIKCSNVVCD